MYVLYILAPIDEEVKNIYNLRQKYHQNMKVHPAPIAVISPDVLSRCLSWNITDRDCPLFVVICDLICKSRPLSRQIGRRKGETQVQRSVPRGNELIFQQIAKSDLLKIRSQQIIGLFASWFVITALIATDRAPKRKFHFGRSAILSVGSQCTISAVLIPKNNILSKMDLYLWMVRTDSADQIGKKKDSDLRSVMVHDKHRL